MMVLIECFTKSNLVKPFYSAPLAASEASVSIDPDISKTQMTDTFFLF